MPVLLLRFPKQISIKNSLDLKSYFNTFANNPISEETVDVIFDETQPSVAVNKQDFLQKFQSDKVRFDLDPNRTRMTLARCTGAGIMSQTHTAGLHRNLNDTTPLNMDHFLSDLGDAAQGAVFVAPMVFVIYFMMQCINIYYKTGQLPSWDSPQCRQLLWESFILGVQSCIIALSIVLAEILIPLLLQALNFQLTGPLIHLPLAPLFGFIYATSLFFYDCIICKADYEQLPLKRFYKNFTLGTGLYLGLLIPGLTTATEAICAFAVPVSINMLWAWGIKQLPRRVLDDQHDTMSAQAGHSQHYQSQAHCL